MIEHHGDRKVSPRNAVACSFQQALTAREPASCWCRLAAEEMAVADPPGAACCRGYVSSVEVCVERALERVCVLLVAAEHVRRPGQQLKILRRESLLLIAAHKQLERLAPSALRVGLTAPREL